MISYLGVTIDELVQSFEDSFAFSDDRTDRVLAEAIEVEIFEGDEDELQAAEEADSETAGEDDDLEDEESTDIFIGDDGQLHAYGETVPFAAEVAVDFLTDYIVADDIDEEWLTLEQARGALLALRILLPDLEEIPEVDCVYSFIVKRDPETGYPNHVTMQPLSSEIPVKETMSFNESAYEGVLSDNTSLAQLFEAANVPEDDCELLADVISEAILALAEEQCGVAIDIKAFAQKIAEFAADQKPAVVESTNDIQH